MVSLVALGNRCFFRKEILSIIATILTVGFGINLIWAKACQNIYNSMVVGNDITAQLLFVRSNPWLVFSIAWENLAQFWADYLRTMVGVIGWIDVYLPYNFTISYLLFLVFLCLTQDSIFGGLRRRLLLNSFAIVTAFAVILAIYISGMPVGANEVLGVQGRYFLAPALVALLANSVGVLEGKWVTNVVVPTTTLIFTTASYAMIVLSMYFRYL